MEKIKMTAEDFKDLQDELERLKTVGRKEIAEKIKVALSFGDLSENSEYDEAKSDQGKMESRINELEATLQNAEIIDDSVFDKDTVNRSSCVRLLDTDMNEEMEYKIVGITKVNPMEGRISDESPLGKAIMGHRAGETVVVEAPAGTIEYKILEIMNED